MVCIMLPYRIEPSLCFDNEVTVTVPWTSAHLLAGCYITKADEIGGDMKENILSQIKLQPEQNFVSDIYIVDTKSKPFKLQRNEKASISFPGELDDDPTKLTFGIHAKTDGVWKILKAKFEVSLQCKRIYEAN